MQNDTEPVKDLDFPESPFASLLDNRFNVLTLKLSLSLKLTSIGLDIYIANIVDFGLYDFGKVSNLGRFKLLVYEQAVHLAVFYVVCDRVQFALCEVCPLGHALCLY